MAEKKYLDSGGLTTLVSNIKSKVETITNQLDNKKATKDELASAESRITAAEKDIDAAEVLLQSISNKLGGIAPGAEVNQNAFSNVKVGSTTVAADAKQDTLELVAGTNVTISADAATDKISISAKDTTYGEATTSAAGLMSATDKTNLNSAVSKLGGIASGAEVNQNAFSNVKVGSTTVAADAKQDTLELVAGDNITISADTATDKISISAKDTTYGEATTSAAGLMSATDKTNLNSTVSKLSGIAPGAEVNQNAFSNVKVEMGDNSTTIAADTKTDTLTLVAGGNITIETDTANDKISISAKDTTYSAATTSAAGLMSAADKTNLNNVVNKLSGVASGAEVNQNAFSNVKVGSTTVEADAKQDTLELVAGTNITIDADTANDKISISTTAEVNQNAFSNVKVGSTTVAADAKQDTLELAAGTNITIDVDAANDKISISAKDTTYSAATTSTAGLMSAADKTNLNNVVNKLSGVAPGAEVNQNAFSNVKVGSTTVEADAKQDTLELAAGTNITIDVDAATDKISISAKDTTYSAATISAAGLMSAADKTNLNNVVSKLSGISSGAEVNQNAFSNIKVGSDTVVADAKQDTVELVQGPAIVIGVDTANDKISISHDEEGPSSGYTSGNTTTSISGSGGSGTIKIPQLTVDKYGHVTTAADESVTITIPTTLKNPKALKFGSKTYDGSAEAEITAADLGLSSALKYHGTTTTAISDGSTTNPIVIAFDGSNHTATQGCVVAYGKKEFVWTGSAWEELGNEGNYKVVQTAVTDPTASGSTTAFIDTISQDTNGKITVTKKNVSFPSSITGNAGTATKLATARTITIGSKGKSFDGSADVSWTLSEIGAAASSHGTHVTYSTDSPKVAGTASAGSSNNVSRGDHVHPAQTSVSGNAGTATKLATARTITIGSKGKSFDGSGDVSWTLSEIGAAASSHGTHVTYSTDNPKVAGTASAGSSNNVSRGDHVHPAQTSVSGNAGTATKLATARTIGLGTGATGTATSFDGSGNITIPVTDIKEAYLSWGGKNYAGSYGPIDAAMVPQLGANRLAFLNPNAVLVEYSTNGGSSWSTYEAANWQKVQLFNGQGNANLIIGGAYQTGVDKTKHMVRITITTEGQVYTALNKFVIYVSTNGSSGCYCTIAARTQANVKSNTNTWITFANNIRIEGWSGYNVINTDNIMTYSNQDSQYGQVRFTFGVSSHSQTYGGLAILSIMGFGGVGWTTPSNLAASGTIYSYDWGQNVTFPAKVTATSLSGSLDASNLTGTVAKARLGAHSHAYTPAGSVGNATAGGSVGNATAGGSVSSTFSGTAHNHTFSGTAHKHTFTGTAHNHTFSGTAATSGGPSGTTSVYSITGVGSLPSCTLPSTTVSYSNGELTITHNAGSFSAGSLPSRSEVTVASNNHTHSVTATGTIGNTTATGSLNEVTATGSLNEVTAGGSVSSTFTGTAHNHGFTGTAHNHSFTGTAGTATTIS